MMTQKGKIITALFIFAGMLFIARTAICAEIKATLKDVKGTVEVKMPGETKWTAAKENMKIGSGTTVKCMANSSAFVKWADGNVVKVYAMTTFELKSITAQPKKNAEKSNVEVTGGKILAKAKKMMNAESSFEVKTPTAIAGVRGTDFAVEVGENQATSVAVVSGEIAVLAEGVEVVVTESLQTVIEMGQPPVEPTPIPPETLENLQTEVEEVSTVAAAPEEKIEAAEEEAKEETQAEAEAEEVAEDVGADVSKQAADDTVQQQINIGVIEEVEEFQECCLPRSY
ncbi:MAG: FecR family protein [bacterium]